MAQTHVVPPSTKCGPWQFAVFDLDGTLVDTRRDLLEALEEAFHPHPFGPAAEERATASLHLGMRAMVDAALGKSANETTVRAITARYGAGYRARITRHSRPYRDVRETLSWLSERGVCMAICSNKPVALTRGLLHELRLEGFFRSIVGPESTGYAKPRPEPLLRAISETRADPSRTVLIGDSRVDVECALAAGVDCWLFSGGYDASAATNATHVFHRFVQLQEPKVWAPAPLPG